MYTYDLSPEETDHIGNPFGIDRIKLISQVRLFIPDTKNSDDEYVFEDEEIDTFLSFEADDVRRTAATALESIITNEALLYKHIEIMNVEIDIAPTTKQLQMRIDRLREESDSLAEWSFV